MGPTSAGASLIDNKPRNLFNYKPNGLKSFEGSLRETFLKVPLKKELRPTDKSKFEPIQNKFENAAREGGIFFSTLRNYFLVFSHCWLAMPQLVLQADWQEVWHSPHPPFFALSQRLRVSRVLICFISVSSEKLDFKIL